MTRKLSAAGLVGLEELTALNDATPTARRNGGESVTRVTPDGDQLVVNLPLSSIRPNPHQPRRTFEPGALRELASSIKQHGRVLQPVMVRPAESGFELVVGERRLRASELAGMPTIRAIVEGVDDATSAEMALAENMARDDLSSMEEARGCAALRDIFGLSVAEIGRRVGRDRTAISHLIRLLDLPDRVQALIEDGTLAEGHGRVLLRLADYDAQKALAVRCASEGWSVRELERQVDALSVAARPAPPQRSADELAALGTLSDSLAPLFGASPVSIVPRRRGSYELHVRFEDLDELRATVSRLREHA
jgi:ParB family transcriptional regulator, chromosome partitioning protein